MPDHIHLLIGLRPVESLSTLVQEIKSDSSGWINEHGFLKKKFSWQEGFGAFSYKKSDLPMIIRYIANQEQHHSRKSLREEYIELPDEFEVDYSKQFIFQIPDDHS